MSNGTNTPFGLRPVISNSGGGAPITNTQYTIAATATGLLTYAQSIFIGDPVTYTPTGYNGNNALPGNIIDIATANAAPFPANNVFPAGTMRPLLGSFGGCAYNSITSGFISTTAAGTKAWIGGTPIVAGTQIFTNINDDINAEFAVQVSNSVNNQSTIYLNSMAGQNANLVIGGGNVGNPAAGNPNTGSAYYLDLSTINVTFDAAYVASNNTLNVTIIGLDSSAFDMQNNPDGTINTLTPGVDMPFTIVRVKINNHKLSGRNYGTW